MGLTGACVRLTIRGPCLAVLQGAAGDFGHNINTKQRLSICGVLGFIDVLYVEMIISLRGFIDVLFRRNVNMYSWFH